MAASQRAVALHPDLPEVQIANAWVLYAGNQYDEAGRAAKQAIESLLAERRAQLAEGELNARLAQESIDVTLPVRESPAEAGRIHPISQVIDELTYSVRKKLFQDISKETVTIRHSVNDIALPNRQLGAFLPGNGVGGAGLHWSGVHFRVDPIELRMRSHYEERYGKNFIPKDMTIQDFGVSYEELEPFFDYAEKVFGTSGQAWTVKGQLVGEGKGGNPYAPDRSNSGASCSG